jgi:hypothetical protein
MSILGLVLARAAIGIGRITTRSSLKAGGVAINPQGPETSFDPSEPNEKKHVHRGGSFSMQQSLLHALHRRHARQRRSQYRHQSSGVSLREVR